MVTAPAFYRWLTITSFAIAMAALEAIVVVYLRQLYYPNGFDFPLVRLSNAALGIECLREAATIVMLATVAMLAVRKNQLKFALFLFLFAVWDIWYYIWLWLLLGWPESLFTWDILFLIPLPWLGPVITPVLCSLAMILYTYVIFRYEYSGIELRILPWQKFCTFFGIALVLYTFMYDYGLIVLNAISEQGTDKEAYLNKALTSFVPQWYNWPVFLAGFAFLILPAINALTRLNSSTSTS
jgi:hypothetical protein